MKLTDNPIFITQQRMVRRGGLLAPLLLAGLIGLSFLIHPVLVLVSPPDPNVNYGRPPEDIREVGLAGYGWITGLEIAVLILGGFNRIAQAMAEDRKAGLWDANRLTPLPASEIVKGYWLGPALREASMAAVLALFGLAIVMVSHLPATLWLETQVLIVSTFLWLGLVAVLSGMTLQRSAGAVILLLGFLFTMPGSILGVNRLVTNFLLPVYGIGHAFAIAIPDTLARNSSIFEPVTIFGFSIYPIGLTLGLQILVGFFIWRILVRKTARPFETFFRHRDAVLLFGLLILTQHALLWDVWRGRWVWGYAPEENGPTEAFLPFVQGCTILLCVVLLALASPVPEAIRVEALRRGTVDWFVIFRRSALPLALSLSAIAAVGLMTHFIHSLNLSSHTYFTTAFNLLETLVIFTLLLEFCRLRHGRRTAGFLILWVFALGVISLILGMIFDNLTLASLSLVSPGFIALANDNKLPDWHRLNWVLAGHLGIALFLLFAWQRQWKKLLGKTVKDGKTAG